MIKALSEIEIIQKKVCVRYFYVIIIVLSLFTVYYSHADITFLNYLISTCLVIHILLFFVPYKLNYESLKPLIPVYLVFISVFIYVEILLFWHFGQITAFLWYSAIPIAAMIFFERKTVIFWSVFVFILICSIFIVTPFIPEKFIFQQLTNSQLIVINIMTIITNIVLVLFFIYYQNKINQIKELQLHKYEVKEENDVKDMSNSTFDNLYADILNYFSEKKPYCNPDFTIAQLAKDLDSNVKYISKAINLKENINFNVFLNKYRINQVKEMIAMNYQNKYTLGYIYFKSGFRNQSTFNKAFKNVEGITPSKYIENKKMGLNFK